jgi:hypothetical protein
MSYLKRRGIGERENENKNKRGIFKMVNFKKQKIRIINFIYIKGRGKGERPREFRQNQPSHVQHGRDSFRFLQSRLRLRGLLHRSGVVAFVFRKELLDSNVAFRGWVPLRRIRGGHVAIADVPKEGCGDTREKDKGSRARVDNRLASGSRHFFFRIRFESLFFF